MYETLANVMDAAIAESEEHEDFVAGKILMLLGSAFTNRRENGSVEFIRVNCPSCSHISVTSEKTLLMEKRRVLELCIS